MIRILGAAAAALFAAPLAAQVAMPAPEFIKQAASQDLYEEASAKLVAKSSNPEVRALAEAISGPQAPVYAAAKADGVPAQPMALTPAQEQQLAALAKVEGDARDKLFAKQQVDALLDSLGRMQAYGASGDKPTLKKVAAETTPKISQTLVLARAARDG